VAGARGAAAGVSADDGRLAVLRRLLGRGGRSGFAVTSAEFEAIVEYARNGPAALAPGASEAAAAASLRVAVVVPWWFEGSGGHTTIVDLVRRLETLGHECSLWLHDPGGRHEASSDEELGGHVRDWFGPMRGAVRRGFGSWQGADVVVATGWQTAHQAALLPGARARAYLVQDHEPEFYATSAEREWADQTYRLGFHCITAGRWLRDLMTQNYGASASHFDLGVDHDVYWPRDIFRSDRVVMFYARTITPRRAVPLGLLALEELARRQPSTEFELYGDERKPTARFEYKHLGVVSAEELAAAYSRAAAGLVLSMTNYSLVAQEMMACELPSVELDTPSARAAFGTDPPLELARFDPIAIADALERLLMDRDLAEARREAGREFVRDKTWDAAAAQVEAGLREALRRADLP
jgi:glycosyltransferase involved in cell wall biosynthesis